MPRTFIVSLPCKPHVAKYAELRYGRCAPIPINNSTAVGALMVGLLQKPQFSYKLSEKDKDVRFRHFTARLAFRADIYLWHSIGYHLTDDHILQANAFLEADFNDRLAIYVWSQTKSPDHRYRGIQDAIEAFAEFYGIELPEMITLDGLKKIEYRTRKRMGKTLITLNEPATNLELALL